MSEAMKIDSPHIGKEYSFLLNTDIEYRQHSSTLTATIIWHQIIISQKEKKYQFLCKLSYFLSKYDIVVFVMIALLITFVNSCIIFGDMAFVVSCLYKETPSFYGTILCDGRLCQHNHSIKLYVIILILLNM